MRKVTFSATVVAVVLLAGCGTTTIGAGSPGKAPTARSAASPAGTKTTAADAAATGAASQASCAGQIGPVGASFISASDGWLLGVTLPQDCWGGSGSRLVVRKTTDGGRRWSPVPAPDAPYSAIRDVAPADSVAKIYFADARDGWAFGPGLWATHDGGATWHRVATGGRSVYSLAATDGHVVAAFLGCSAGCYRGNASSFTIETSPAGADGWKPVRGAAGVGQPTVTAAAGTAYALGASSFNSRTLLLTGPADGATPWQRHETPCMNIGNNTATAVTANSLLMACALLGAHPAPTSLYRSDDSGAHWQKFSQLGLYDGADSVDVTPDGMLLVAGIYNGIAISRDAGRTWQQPAAVDEAGQTGGGGHIDAAMTTNDAGFVIVTYGPLWITGDGGRTWTQVRVR